MVRGVDVFVLHNFPRQFVLALVGGCRARLEVRHVTRSSSPLRLPPQSVRRTLISPTRHAQRSRLNRLMMSLVNSAASSSLLEGPPARRELASDAPLISIEEEFRVSVR